MTETDGALRVCESLDLGEGATAPFLGGGNVWIEDAYDETTIGTARHAIMRAIADTAKGELRIVGYDESLSGLFAPFSSLIEDEPRVIDLIEEERELSEQLVFLRHQVHSIQNSLKGQPSLTQYRRDKKTPVEGYVLVALGLLNVNMMSPFASDLRKLMRQGPAMGISFLIVAPLPSEAERNMYANTVFLEFGRSYPQARPAEIVELCDGMRGTREKVRKTVTHEGRLTIEFSSLYPELDKLMLEPSENGGVCWNRDSIDGLEFAVGTYADEVRTIVLGDDLNQRHNVLITGAVGQGKSNLISVIVHSLCLNYSPDELELYLLDFKEGVTFQSFANVGREEFLPHARTIGLESDVEFGVAVLEALYDEYMRRLRLFKSHNVRSIKELREKFSETRMPRIVVVIDEFQLMFGDGNNANYVADLLERSVRLFRAAGIHFILSSQTLGGNLALDQRSAAIFGQVPIRIALKNSLSESYRTLSQDNPAAAYLQPREAIINVNYGSPAHNRKAMVAYANEDYLAPARKFWWELASKDGVEPPYIYDSARKSHISADGMLQLRDMKSPYVLLGERVSVKGELMGASLAHEPGRNIALVGAQDEAEHAIGMMQAAALSIAVHAGDRRPRFVFCDFSVRGEGYLERFRCFDEAMKALGHEVEEVEREDFDALLEKLAAGDDFGEVYVFASMLENRQRDSGSFGMDPLLEFARRGPSRGKHFIGWWVTPQSLGGPFGSEVAEQFNTKVFLHVGMSAVASIVGPQNSWRPRSNRAYAVDVIEAPEGEAFVPYVPLSEEDLAAWVRSESVALGAK